MPISQEDKGVGSSGQTWQDVTGSRAANTTYTNSTGKPIQVLVAGVSGGVASITIQLTVGGVALAPQIGYCSGAGNKYIASAIIPPNVNYSVAFTNCTLGNWTEMR